jgi:hypothetical protein
LTADINAHDIGKAGDIQRRRQGERCTHTTFFL